jgi:hypothetical protein
VGEESLVEGNSVSQLGGAIFQLGGAGVASILSDKISTDPIVVFGAVVYGLAALFALPIKKAGETRARSTLGREVARIARSIAEGLREVARTPKAGASITTYFWLRLLWSFSLLGIGLVVRELLGDDDTQVLIVTGGPGAVGAVLGFVMARRLHTRFRSSADLVLAASAVAGIAVATLGGFDVKVTLGLLTFFLGFGFFLAKISLDTMVQEALGDDFRGRAFSLYDISYNLAWVVAAGVMEIGWSDDLQGMLIAGMGVVFLVGMVGIAAWFRRAGLLRPPVEAAAEVDR